MRLIAPAAWMARSKRSLFKKSGAYKIKNFTGIDAPYELPENPKRHLTTICQEPY
jgi:bifunctional enzyme CysN/CysC